MRKNLITSFRSQNNPRFRQHIFFVGQRLIVQVKRVCFFLLFFLFFAVPLRGSDFLIWSNQNYYNPFAVSFNFLLKPLIKMKPQARQNIKLEFCIRDLQTSQNIVRSNMEIDFLSDVYDIYFFLKYDSKKENMAMSIHIPHNSIVVDDLGFIFPNFLAADIGYLKKLTGKFGEEFCLMNISPLNGKIIIGNLYHKNFFYKKSDFRPLTVYMRITRVPARLDVPSPIQKKHDYRAISSHSLTELREDFDKVERNYRAGKATLQELNQAQERLNVFYLKQREFEKKGK